MKRTLSLVLTTLLFLVLALPVKAFPVKVATNYMAGADGYAPADYDGDGKADWAMKDSSGAWVIDYASNGLGSYDAVYYGYGGTENVAVPADYDGDGKADLAVKSNTLGEWSIDYASNGFGTWDATYYGYGGSQNKPCPEDYDGDRMADLAVKSDGGVWAIDYASNGFGTWDAVYYGYGGPENIPVPADYDQDGKADLAIWTSSGYWNGTFNVDFAKFGFGSWDVSWRWILPGPGRPAVGDFNGDCVNDFSVKRDDGSWTIAYAGHSCAQTCEFLCGSVRSLSFETFYGYGDSLNRPVPANYHDFSFTDLAVRAETDPTALAIDYRFNGFGTWDDVFHP